jgi:DNA topoisomerase-2
MGKKTPNKKGKGQRLNPFQAVRKRPDWAIGSPITIKDDRWVWSDENKMMIMKNITFNNGLFNIIREIGSNAIDNKWRSEKEQKDNPDVPTMKKIEFKVDIETGEISVCNDGYQLPVEQQEFEYTDHRTNETTTEVMYPAEIYFGDMFAGTNYDDMDEEEFVKEVSSGKEGRKTSGRNGMGAKAANIFSTEFTIDHTDTVNKKRFLQKYSECGQKREKPSITSYRNKTGYTRITFTPDYKYFKFPDKSNPRMTKNFYAFLKGYAYEMAMVTGLPITFNDEKIVVKSLEKYARLFYPSLAENKMILIATPLGDEAVLVEGNEPETESLDNVTHTSFINGIHTSRGGKYVDLFRDAIFSGLVRSFNSRKKKVSGKQLKTTAKKLYPYFHLFVRCEAIEPPFDSQTKDHCILERFDFFTPKSQKQKAEWAKTLEGAVAKILRWNFISSLEEKLLAEIDRANSKKEKSDKKRMTIGKQLTEANLRQKKPLECIICFTEGDSAKTLVTRGSNNPDYIGSLALRGKILNVSKHSRQVVNGNRVLQQVKQVIGLKSGLDYTREEFFGTLRYGKTWLMMDRDDDGLHIQGLLLNFFYREFPSLLQRGFVSGFNTAVVQLWHKAPKQKQLGTKRFYTNSEYQEWCKTDEYKEMAKHIKEVKYYKGLGTIEPKDAPIYFEDPKIVDFKYWGKREKTMDMAWSDKDKDKKDRKEWIKERLEQESEGKTFGDVKYEGDISLKEFVNDQLILYNKVSIRRAIPCVYDGLKDCQRKALYSALKRKRAKQIKFVIAAGDVISDTAYHHGDDALRESIIKMGQGFVGSNNIPYFENAGEYGSRLLGTSDDKTHASPRYLFFKMEEIVKTIFPEDDFPLYKQVEDNNELLEYEYFVPVIPMLLVNGSIGIACGFSTDIPGYNPEDLVQWIRVWLQDREEDTHETENLPPLIPWYNGFKGEIYLKTEKGQDKWVSEGILEKGTGKKVEHKGKLVMKSDAGWWHIKDLPIGTWTEDFKKHLDYLEFGSVEGKKGKSESKKSKTEVKCLSDVRVYNSANIVHFMIKPTKDFIPDMDTKGNMDCLRSTRGLTNMVAIDEHNVPYNYTSPEEILEKYTEKRIDLYWRRKRHFLEVYKHNLLVATNKYTFVKAVVERELDMHQPPETLEADMKNLGLKKIGDEGKENYDYLLNMAMRSMTPKRLEELKKEKEKWKRIRDELKEKSEEDLWREDLDKFEIAYKKFLKTRTE